MDCCVTNLWSLQENCNQDYYFSQSHILTSWHKLQAHHRRLNMLPQWKGNQISLLVSPRILLSCRLSYIDFFLIYQNDKFSVERKIFICNIIVMPWNIKYVAPKKRKFSLLFVELLHFTHIIYKLLLYHLGKWYLLSVPTKESITSISWWWFPHQHNISNVP